MSSSAPQFSDQVKWTMGCPSLASPPGCSTRSTWLDDIDQVLRFGDPPEHPGDARPQLPFAVADFSEQQQVGFTQIRMGAAGVGAVVAQERGQSQASAPGVLEVKPWGRDKPAPYVRSGRNERQFRGTTGFRCWSVRKPGDAPHRFRHVQRRRRAVPESRPRHRRHGTDRHRATSTSPPQPGPCEVAVVEVRSRTGSPSR